MTSPLSYWAVCLLVGGTLPTLAPARPDPADAQLAVPPQIHESALQRFRPLREDEPLDWRSANRRVQQAGGWRAYAREAAASAPPSSAHQH